jgi:hypothetical protein
MSRSICWVTMAINPVRIDYLKVCGFVHSQNKFSVRNLVKLSIAENLFSAGLMNENTVKTCMLQHLIYSGLGGVDQIFKLSGFFLLSQIVTKFITSPSTRK